MCDAFSQRFPGLRIDIVQADADNLIARIKAEVASGQFGADVVDHADRGSMKGMEALFADYEPPNSADYFEASLVSPKLWPRVTPGWVIASNTELLKKAPTSWTDLTNTQYGDGQIGEVIATAGPATWTRIMFERRVLGDAYWGKQAATKPVLYPTNALAADALASGEISAAPLLSNTIIPRERRGAPVTVAFPPEGIPIAPNAAGIAKAARHSAAARLFLDWSLSDEGQTYLMKEHGYLTSLKKPPFIPEGLDLATTRPWTPQFEDFQTLHDKWIADWNRAYVGR